MAAKKSPKSKKLKKTTLKPVKSLTTLNKDWVSRFS